MVAALVPCTMACVLTTTREYPAIGVSEAIPQTTKVGKRYQRLVCTERPQNKKIADPTSALA